MEGRGRGEKGREGERKTIASVHSLPAVCLSGRYSSHMIMTGEQSRDYHGRAEGCQPVQSTI